MDSGCSRHMTGNKNLFLSLTAKDGGCVTFGDNGKGKIKGVGEIGNASFKLIDVLFVKGLKHNLISISQLCDKGGDDADLWHRRLGHASMKLLQKLSKNELVRGLPPITCESNKVCEACIKGKFVRSSHKTKNLVSTTKPLHMLHLDLFGPVSTQSLGGKKYCLVVVDDYSRFTWVMFLANKSDCFKEFEKFSKRVEKRRNSQFKL